MKERKRDDNDLNRDNPKPGRKHNNAYMIAVLVLLLVVAIVAFIIDTKVNTPAEELKTEESGAHMNIADGNALEQNEASESEWTVYGELNRDELLEQLKTTIVRIEAESADDSGILSGSGVVIAITDTHMDIVTASHVVELTATPTVCFYDGSGVSGSVLAYGKQNDVAFVRVELSELKADSLGRIQTAKCGDSEYYSELQLEEPVYMIGSVSAPAGDLVEGFVKAKEQFVVLFQNDMLLCSNSVADGMSGGGTFCKDGNLIGIIVGTDDADTVNVRITDVMAEYRSVSQ